MQFKDVYSPNYAKRKNFKRSLKAIIIHYTGMQSERESLKRLCDPKSKVSCHYLINRKGKIFRLVKDKNIAWHAGLSCWGKYKKINNISIGIELVNKGHQFGYTNFTDKQIYNLVKLCKLLIKKYKIKKNYIIGHSDIAPLRKQDPGERFPWKYLAKNKIGIWHNHSPNFLKTSRKIKILRKKDKINFINNLRKIGYCFKYKNKGSLNQIIKAFQRHFRKELINGIIDRECLIISENLLKKL